MLIKWKQNFPSHIRDRGYEYAMSNFVTVTHEEPHRIEARVWGMSPYDVTIDYDHHQVTAMTCTCPYAAKGHNCKHMAAVLYQVELEEAVRQSKDIIAIETLQRDKEAVEELLSLYKNDDDWDHYGDDYDEYDSFALNDALSEWLEDTVPSRLDAHEVLSAFNAVREVWIQFADINMYDEYDEVVGECLEYYDAIFEQMTPKQERSIFEWLLEWAEVTGDGATMDLLVKYFQTKEATEKKIAAFDRRIASEVKSYDKIYSSPVDLSRAVNYRIMFMRQLGATKEEVAAYRSQYRYLEDIQQDEIADILEEDTETAIDHLTRIQATLPNEEKQQYIDALIPLYHKANRQDDYRSLLYYTIFTYRQKNVNHLLAYKECCTDKEWQSILEQVKKSNTTYQIYESLLVKTQEYERLMAWVESEWNGGVSRLERLEGLLGQRYPRQVRNRYTHYVLERFPHCKTKRDYEDIVRYLKKIVRYEGGRTMVDKVLNDWRATYPRRRRFWDEVEKARLI